MNFLTLFRKNLAFLVPVLIFIITGIVFLSLFSKDAIHLTTNAWFSTTGDIFFIYTTMLGEGLAFLILGLILVFIKWRYLAGMLIAAVLTLLTVGFLKNVVYQGELRPVKYFENKHELRLVEGITLHHMNSFPSGHTTTAFACWGFAALLIPLAAGKFAMFLLALLVGCSRIYLSQHFLEDVVAGAFLGTLIAIVSYYLMHLLKNTWSDKRVQIKRRPRT